MRESSMVLLTGEGPRYCAALLFAKTAHGMQVRKYTGEPYWYHLKAVAALVSQVRGRSVEMIEASLLHDTIEDTEITGEQIEAEFGPLVRAYVEALTEPPAVKGGPNRAARKQMVCVRMLTMPWAVKTIKLANLIDNTQSIATHDPTFAKVYLPEKRMLLNYLLGGDQELWNKASVLADQQV